MADPLAGCRSVECFKQLNTIDEGTYGVVYRAQDKETGEVVALKRVKLESAMVEREGFPITSLREVNALLTCNHPNIVGVKEVVVGSSQDDIFMVMEYMEHDLKTVMEEIGGFRTSHVKQLLIQLLAGTQYMHENWMMHRDLKTSNLLYDNGGKLKICDFGLVRAYADPVESYTPYDRIVTLWYRAPELLMGAPKYTTALDMWSVGCIFAELLLNEPMFRGEGELDQMRRIVDVLGMPSEKVWPGYSSLPNPFHFVGTDQRYNKLREIFPPNSFTGGNYLTDCGLDLLQRMLALDPAQRITAEEALAHPYLTTEAPRPCDPLHMPTCKATHESDARRRKARSPDQRKKLLAQLADDFRYH